MYFPRCSVLCVCATVCLYVRTSLFSNKNSHALFLVAFDAFFIVYVHV